MGKAARRSGNRGEVHHYRHGNSRERVREICRLHNTGGIGGYFTFSMGIQI